MHATRPLVALAALATVAGLSVAGTASAAGSSHKPGVAGPAITLGRHLSITSDNTDIVMTSDGTAYAAWISSSAGSSGRTISGCVLPPGATQCKGGVQSVDSLDSSGAEDLKMLVVKGTPTVLWLDASSTIAAITATTFNPAGTLLPPTAVAKGPANGELLDAKVGPDGQIWTLTYDGLPAQHLEVHDGLTAAGQSVKASWPIGFASLAFNHSQAVVVATDAGAIGTPPAYSASSGTSFPAMKNVKHTWAIGSNVGLVHTSHGLRLITGIGNADYWPVIAKWTGHGFSHPKPTGDKSPCHADAHDASTDKSGRIVDAGNECGKITVANLSNASHSSLIRFSSGGTNSGDRVQVVSSPRGHAWVMWGIEDHASGGSGTALFIVPVLLPDNHASKTSHGKHGSVTVTGPASCMPADTISDGVKAKAEHGWKVASKRLTLNGKKVGGSINGASLTPGKKYTLVGTAALSGGGHEKLTAKLTFKACPSP